MIFSFAVTKFFTLTQQLRVKELIMNRFKNLFKFLTVLVLAFSWVQQPTAEDTEIYQATAASTSTGRPKVLIVFDDSGSMGTNVTVQPPAYDPDTVYDGNRETNRIYFATNDSSEYFPISVNRCAESYTALATVGTFTSKIQRASTSTDNRWRDLNDSDYTRGTSHVDCEADLINNNPSNGPGQPDGYPCEGGGDISFWYCSTKKTIAWNTDTLYTGNYVNWANSVGTTTRSRMDIAQETIKTIIDANPAIDFGLVKFNYSEGGQVRKRIIENSTILQRNALQDDITDLNSGGWTPLCETTYEAYRYLSGLSVDYGDNETGRDLLAETSLTSKIYDSPASDCAYTYVIIMTDGEPSQDTARNTTIETLTGKTCNNYRDYSGNMVKNCLPEIAEYMANTDLDNNPINGDQFAITYTIGFATDQVLLKDTASKGKGEYYTADSATGLAEAFQSAITEILGTNESFTSPAVAVDTFSRTESRNEVFFAMFEPTDRVNWKGNIKRLNLVIESGIAVLKDANNNPAFNDTTGRISDDAQTVWSTTTDGDKVAEGGVGAILAARDPSTRKVFSNIGLSNALKALTPANVTASSMGVSTDTELFDLFGVDDQAELTNMIYWGLGYDVDDLDEDSARDDAQPWILSDMLHSRPVVINYGALGSHSKVNPDQRLVVGTNGGFLHMFDVDTGAENWAFFPKELSEVLGKRRANVASTQHVYGIDAPASIYTSDGGDGTIDANSNDKALIFFGLRRGGRNLYALDISNPDAPSYLWQIEGGSGAFAELGQTWSVPIVTKIPGYKYDHDSDGSTPEVAKPVLVFGAGYDTNKDGVGLASADSMGRGVYVVDAFTGALVWSITPAVNSGTNMQATALQHSIPSNITLVDANGDTLTDRLYFGDTGGNLWRVDMPGEALPTSAQDTWYLTKMAAVNGGTIASDRRFFSAPDVVRTKQKICTEFYPAPKDDVCKIVTNVNYDAVLIGTGDRTNPNALDVDNQFYMFRDKQLGLYDTVPQTPSECSTALSDPDIPVDFRCHLPFSTSSLYDATANLIQVGTTTEQVAAELALQNAHGWLLNLGASGEKSLARAISLYGSVFFTTFSPNSGGQLSCTPQAGKGRLYQVNIQNASAKRDFNNDGVLDRSIDLGTLIPDTPAPHFGSDKKIRLLFPSGGGMLSGNPLDTGAQLPQPYGVYWYKEET